MSAPPWAFRTARSGTVQEEIQSSWTSQVPVAVQVGLAQDGGGGGYPDSTRAERHGVEQRVERRAVRSPLPCSDHGPTRCRAALPRTDAARPAVRQVPDLPKPLPLVVTEHQAHAVDYPGCRVSTRAVFPEDVDGPVQFGRWLKAAAACLRYAQHLPVARGSGASVQPRPP